jgi:hypothetical protein
MGAREELSGIVVARWVGTHRVMVELSCRGQVAVESPTSHSDDVTPGDPVRVVLDHGEPVDWRPVSAPSR